MAPATWPLYWLGHGWAQAAFLLGPVAVFCVARLIPRAFPGIDYAVHFHGNGSTHDGALSMPPHRPVPVPYRASLRVMNTGRSEVPEADLPGGVVITVRPAPAIMVAMVASTCIPRGTVTVEPVGPAQLAVIAERLRPGDWMDVDLLTDRPVTVDHLTADVSGPGRTHTPRRRRLREFDPTQLAVDLIGLPVAVGAVVLVAHALPHQSQTPLDVAARYGWLLLALWAVLSLWGVMDQCVRFAQRHRWQGHPRVFLQWGDPRGTAAHHVGGEWL